MNWYLFITAYVTSVLIDTSSVFNPHLHLLDENIKNALHQIELFQSIVEMFNKRCCRHAGECQANSGLNINNNVYQSIKLKDYKCIHCTHLEIIVAYYHCIIFLK